MYFYFLCCSKQTFPFYNTNHDFIELWKHIFFSYCQAKGIGKKSKTEYWVFSFTPSLSKVKHHWEYPYPFGLLLFGVALNLATQDWVYQKQLQQRQNQNKQNQKQQPKKQNKLKPSIQKGYLTHLCSFKT